MNNVGVIDTFLNTFTTYIDSGFGLIQGEITSLASTLIVIDITLACLFWAWGADEGILQRLVKKTLYIGFFAFNTLSGVIFNSFAGLGLKAGGSSISTADFLRPGRLAQVGLDAGHPLPDDGLHQLLCELRPGCGADGVLAPGPDRLFILAVKLFVTLIEFKLTTLAGFILFPFALFNKTAFLAEKVLGNVVASVKVMVLAVIVDIGTGLSRSSPPPMAAASRRSSRRSVVLAALAMLGPGAGHR
ncbi:P-type conjugative transfer protein TrbL [Bradyrhizobium hipponense]|uniref:P-type conjugative transfer protein TrbL n=1 Tax=Bradyrhizobium hipponense TaxID=2605638 RepID=A0A5S4YGJ9_9BRAD|nr:P-type conjugative transfer protein TrbL [Bradyrhizobium hipponense]TYO63163.1 P-type conjugative transfer protein TrbL [Bradyrhizobium hipponense]